MKKIGEWLIMISGAGIVLFVLGSYLYRNFSSFSLGAQMTLTILPLIIVVIVFIIFFIGVPNPEPKKSDNEKNPQSTEKPFKPKGFLAPVISVRPSRRYIRRAERYEEIKILRKWMVGKSELQKKEALKKIAKLQMENENDR